MFRAVGSLGDGPEAVSFRLRNLKSSQQDITLERGLYEVNPDISPPSEYPQPGTFIYQDSILELSAAIKPYVIELLMNRGYSKVIYFDPDILQAGSYNLGYIGLRTCDESRPDLQDVFPSVDDVDSIRFAQWLVETDSRETGLINNNKGLEISDKGYLLQKLIKA